jgi:putative Mg2+ transporter-C (MgtC) family protein
VALTYALGFERDLRGAPTGDRVFALIGAGAGAIGIIAAHGAPNALAGAITGVGFIGGGLVFRQTLGQNQVLMGITTAAAIFAAAAIGAAAGEGRLLVAAMGTVLALLVLEIRHSKVLNLLDGRRYADRFKQDTQDPHLPATRPGTSADPVARLLPLPQVPGAGPTKFSRNIPALRNIPGRFATGLFPPGGDVPPNRTSSATFAARAPLLHFQIRTFVDLWGGGRTP